METGNGSENNSGFELMCRHGNGISDVNSLQENNYPFTGRNLPKVSEDLTGKYSVKTI
jgi:hypothetical protein